MTNSGNNMTCTGHIYLSDEVNIERVPVPSWPSLLALSTWKHWTFTVNLSTTKKEKGQSASSILFL